MPIKPDDPAYPQLERFEVQGKAYWRMTGGLSIRAEFAKAAMQGLLASGMTYSGETTNRALVGADAVAHADALISALNAEPEKGDTDAH